MSRISTGTHHERDLSSDPSFPTYTITNPNANITSQHDQTVAFSSEPLPPRRRPRGNTFGLPAPDTGKMLVPTRTEGFVKQQREVNEQYDEEDHDEPYSYHDMDPHNQDHTFGVNMPQLAGRRSRADSYASTTSAYSYTYPDASRTYGADRTRVEDMPAHHNEPGQSSIYATGTMSPQDSMYGGDDNKDRDRTSMLTSTTMDFHSDWSSAATGEPRGSITSFLTFGQSAAPRRISVVGGGGGGSGGHDVGGSTAIKSSINGGVSTLTATARHGVSISPASSLSPSSSHAHTITRTLRHPEYKVSPHPSVESLRSSHSVLGSSSGLNPAAAGPTGIIPLNISATNNTSTNSHPPSSMSNNQFSTPPGSARTGHTIHKTQHSASSTQSIIPASFRSVQSLRQRSGAHRIHRSDSLEKLHARRRSTVSSIGSTSGPNGVLTFNSASNTATRTNGTVTPSAVVGRPKSGSGSGISRLAIGVLQEREMREKGKAKEKPSTPRDDQPSQESQLGDQELQKRQQQLTVSLSLDGVVSPSGSLFIESFHSPIEHAFNSNLKGVTSKTASGPTSYHRHDGPTVAGDLSNVKRADGSKDEEADSVSDGEPEGDEHGANVLPKLLTRSHRNATPQAAVKLPSSVNEENRERSINIVRNDGSGSTYGNGIFNSEKTKNAVQRTSQPVSNANVNSEAQPSSSHTITNPLLVDTRTQNRINVSFPSPFLSFTSATTASPNTSTASPTTRRLLHSVSQPSLRSFVQDTQSPSKSNLNQIHPPPLPTSPPSQHQFVSEPHPYAMYSGQNYASVSGSHNVHLSKNADPRGSSNPNLADVPNASGSMHASHPYSYAYLDSRQKDVRNNSSFLAIPFDSQPTSAPATTQATPPPSGFKRTLRSSFKLPGSSRPSSDANATEGNVGTLAVPGKTRTSTGGSLRSLRSSVSTPNLRNLFKFGHSTDNKPRDDGGHVPQHATNQSANAKGKQPAQAGPSSGVKQPTTPKKTKHPKTQYTAETWCDALLFPRPRFRAHVTSPPASPIHVSALPSANSQSQPSPGIDWVLPNATASNRTSPNMNGKHTAAIPPRTPPPRESHFTTDLYFNAIPPPPHLKPAPKGKIRKGSAPPLPGSSNTADDDRVEPELQSMLSALEQALIAGEVRDREREKWNEVAKSSFQNRRSRSLSRSRKRAGTTSTMTSSAPSAPSERGRGRGRNLSDAGRKSEERTHAPTSSISRSLAAGLTSIAAEAFRQPTPTISTVSHHGRGTGGSHHGHQTTTMTTDSHSYGYHSRTTSESGPASQRHGHSRNTSWGKAALKKLCGATSEDEDDIRPPEDDGVVVTRGRPRVNKDNEVTEEGHRAVNETSRNQLRHEGNTGIRADFSANNKTSPNNPVIFAAERSLSPNSCSSEHKDVVIALSTPPPHLCTPNGSVIEFPDLSDHPYAQSRTFPASAPYAGPYPSSRDYKPLYTPKQNTDHRRLHSTSTGNTVSEVVQAKPVKPPPLHLEPIVRDDGTDSQSSHRRKADPTPYAYANVTENSKRESTLGVEEALLSSSSFRRFVDAILEDVNSDNSDAIDVLAEAETPKHSPGIFLNDDDEEPSPYPVLRDIPTLSNSNSPSNPKAHSEAQYIQHIQQDPNTTLSSPSSQSSTYSRMSRPFGAVDDLEPFRDLFFKPFHSPLGSDAVQSSDSSRFFPRSPSTNSPKDLGSSDLLFGGRQSKGSGNVIRSQSQARQFSYERERGTFSNDGDTVRSPSLMGLNDAALHLALTEPVVYTSGQDFPEDIESSRASSVIDHEFMKDTLRLGIVRPSIPVTTESGERPQSSTLSFIDNAPKRDTIMSTASVYSLPSVQGLNNNELRESFVTSASSSTSGVTRLLGNFPTPPPPLVGSASRPDSYHFLGLAESNRIATSTSKT